MTKQSKSSQKQTGSQGLLKFFHLISIVQFSYAIYYNANFVPSLLTPDRDFGGKYKYLTVINVVREETLDNDSEWT
jgi:hypothetical protein